MWQTARHEFPGRPGSGTALWLSVAVKAAAALALVSLCLEYGFDEPALPVGVLLGCQGVAVLLYVAELVHRLAVSRNRLADIREHSFDLVLIVGGSLAILVLFEFTHFPVLRAAVISLVVVQVMLALRFGVGVVRFNLEVSQRGLHPARLMVLSFVGLILVGGALLSLPRSMSPEHRHEEGDYEAKRVLNCFFTSASATCVTGLVVYDTGADFSRAGQTIILVLIQMGGLGIMIFGSLFGLLVGRQLSLRQSLALQDALSHQTIGRLRQMVRFIVAATFSCELIGAVLLYSMWGDRVGTVGDRVFHSVFHSISAFCNAGFALQGDSLVSYRGCWQVYISIMPLIVLGGLGFPVLFDLYGWAKWRIKGRSRRVRRHRFSLHSKLVLVSSAILIVVPALLLLLAESAPEWRSRNQIESAQVRAGAEGQVSTMADLPLAGRVGAALFQSVTTRTAGFNTVHLDVNSLSPASRFLMCVLMFIGGSPASTAGGVKTVAVAVLLLGVYSTLRRRPNVEGFGRTIPQAVMGQAAVVLVMMAVAVGVFTLALCYTEAATLAKVLFEVVSACGTVGLSTGLTDELTIAGRVLIILAMFVGRLGPLTVLIALAGRTTSARYDYPEEHPVIG